MTRELAEKETVILFNPVDKMASVWTYDKTWQKHIEERLGVKPNVIHGKTDHEGARDYTVPKSSIAMPKAPKKLSAATKKKFADNLAKAREKRRAPVLAPAKQKAGGKGRKKVSIK